MQSVLNILFRFHVGKIDHLVDHGKQVFGPPVRFPEHFFCFRFYLSGYPFHDHLMIPFEGRKRASELMGHLEDEVGFDLIETLVPVQFDLNSLAPFFDPVFYTGDEVGGDDNGRTQNKRPQKDQFVVTLQ